ncbi:MAG: tyrosine-type recombinase/integrase [Bdellovibrionia bacterium]
MTEMDKNIQRINFTIKYPNFKGRNTFALLKVIHYKNGTKKAETITNDRIKAINQEWEKSKQTETKRDELLKLVKEIRAEVHRSQQIKDGKVRLVKHTDNQKILSDFVSERIEDRKIVNPKGHEQDFTRAVLVIDRENLSLKTATRKELQKAVNKIDRNTIHRRVCSRLNSLLGFIGRRERLEPAEYTETPTIFTETEFLNLVENIEAPEDFKNHKEDIKNLFFTLFYTGLRVGEAFAVFNRQQMDKNTGRPLNCLLENYINVNSQMLKDSKKMDSTKTGNTRKAYVIQNHIHRVKAWADLDRTTKEKLRKVEFSYLIKKAGRLTFPKDDEKQNLKAHDCRHSYSVHLLNSGVSISLIAKSLGNSVLVCEKYYLGYALQDEGVQMIHQLMSQQPRLKKVG